MKTKLPLFKALAAILLLAISCSQKNAEQEAMKQEAVALHEAAFEIYADMKPHREQIPNLREEIKEKILELEREGGDTTRVQALIDVSISLKEHQEALNEWLDNVVEPDTDHNHGEHSHDHEHGDHDHAEHDHDHGDHAHADHEHGHEHEDHDHSHHDGPQVTPIQMLEIQKNIKSQIEELQGTLKANIEKAEQLLAGQA